MCVCIIRTQVLSFCCLFFFATLCFVWHLLCDSPSFQTQPNIFCLKTFRPNSNLTPLKMFGQERGHHAAGGNGNSSDAAAGDDVATSVTTASPSYNSNNNNSQYGSWAKQQPTTLVKQQPAATPVQPEQLLQPPSPAAAGSTSCQNFTPQPVLVPFLGPHQFYGFFPAQQQQIGEQQLVMTAAPDQQQQQQLVATSPVIHQQEWWSSFQMKWRQKQRDPFFWQFKLPTNLCR